MLRRSTKFQLALFVIITLLGISYVSAEYVGLGGFITGNTGCTVSADFTNSGGIFSAAEVTYRGVTVGKVGALHLEGKTKDLPKGGVRVDLDLDSCTSPKIPASASANIANRSVVGEQYVDLVPPPGATSTSAHLEAHDTISASKNTTPVATEKLLGDLDDLVNSVPLNSLKTTVSELGKAVAGRGDDLGSLLDSTNSLLQTASQPDNLNATLTLIEDAQTVLGTQLAEQAPLQSWAHSLNLLSAQLKKSDPDIRRLLDNGPGDLDTVTSFIQNNKTDIGVTLANLSTVGNLLVEHLGGVEEILELYPALAAGGETVVQPDPKSPGHNVGALGLVLQATPDPQDCGDPNAGGQGYSGTVRRQPGAVAPIASNVAAQCTAPASSGTNVRGSANVPGGDPISLSGGGYAYPRVTTQNVTGAPKAASVGATSVQVGPALAKSSALGDGSFVALMTDAVQ
jgi:phospholipid/cholesterol/gamma-HCH transport system substrate-binding protein